MASKATWNKWGLRLDIQTSKRPLPKTPQAYPLPDFGEALASIITATYYTSSTVKGPYIVISESNGPATGETWWIGHSTDGASWEERPVSAGPLVMNWYRPEESRTHYFRLRVEKSGVSVNHPPVSVYVPVRPPAHFSGPTLPPPGDPYRIGDRFTVDGTGVQWQLTLSGWVDVKGLADSALADLIRIASDGWLTRGEKPQAIRERDAFFAAHGDMLAKASAAGVSASVYDAAAVNLDSYLIALSPALTDTAQDTAIVAATWSTNWATAYAERTKLQNAITAAAQSGVNTINDPDTLSLNEKPQIIQDYGAITGEHAKLLADGAAFAPTERAAYVAAYDALVVSYLPTLTSPVAWNSLSGTTALGTGNRVALWNPKWQAVRDTANLLRSANTSGAYNLALNNAATDAQNKANLAQLRSQPHKVAWAYASKPTLPDTVNYPAGYYAITTDWKQVQVNPAGTAWDDVLVAATGVFGKLFASQVVIGGTGGALNADPQCQDIGSWVGYGVSIQAIPWGRCGTTALCVESASSPAILGTELIPIDTTKTYRISAWAIRDGAATGNLYLGLAIQDGNGNNVPGNGTFWYVGAVNAILAAGSAWYHFQGTIGPAGSGSDLTWGGTAKTARMMCLPNYGGSNAAPFYIQDFRLEEVIPGSLIVPGTVTSDRFVSDLALVNTIRSTNYTAGTSSAAPVGFKQSGQTFTTTYIGGATASDCQFELGGSANMMGRRLDGIVTKVEGGFVEWTTPGSYNWTCPPGIYNAQITLIGGGGGGAGGVANLCGGGGGGAGGSISINYSVTPGTVYAIVVGAGGAAGAAGGNGGNGGYSQFASSGDVRAFGGDRGLNTSESGQGRGASVASEIDYTDLNYASAGGTGGNTQSIMSLRYSATYQSGAGGGGGAITSGGTGGNGGRVTGGHYSYTASSGGDAATGWRGGGGGGQSSMGKGGIGGTGTNSAYYSGRDGVDRGAGGGGGAASASTGYAGGAGANGYVSIRY